MLVKLDSSHAYVVFSCVMCLVTLYLFVRSLVHYILI